MKIAALFSLLLLAAFVSADEIEPIEDWNDYRDRILEDGYSPNEADARIASMLGSLRSMDRAAGADRIGVPAPPFRFDAWLDFEPLTLDELRGRVVLVRWWTDTCPFCASSAPALRTLHEQYGPQGLTVLGVFHPKARRDDPLDLPRVRRAVDQRAFEFPISLPSRSASGRKSRAVTKKIRTFFRSFFLYATQGTVQVQLH